MRGPSSEHSGLDFNSDGTVKDHQKISATSGGFTGELDDFSEFGQIGTALLGDVNNDGDADIAYGLLLADKQWGSNGRINARGNAL